MPSAIQRTGRTRESCGRRPVEVTRVDVAKTIRISCPEDHEIDRNFLVFLDEKEMADNDIGPGEVFEVGVSEAMGNSGVDLDVASPT
jgi:hypothetical protein